MAHQEGLALKMVAGSSADGTKALRQALHESAEEIYTTIEKLMLQDITSLIMSRAEAG